MSDALSTPARSDAAAEPSPTAFDWPFVRLILVVVLGGMMAFLDATIVNVGVQALREEFGAGLETVQWVATGYLLAVAAVTPVTGWLMDRFGGRRMWLVGLAWFVAGSALCALAWSAGSLVVFRVLQGIGGGMLEPLMLALLVRAAGPARVGRLMGLLGAVTVSSVLGPLLGGTVLAGLNWHWLFLINVPIGLAAIALAARHVPRDAPRDGSGTAPAVDVRGIALLCPGSAAFMFGLSRAGEGRGFLSAPVLVALALGAALLVAYVVHARRREDPPLIDVRLFARRTYTASALGMAVLGVALFSLMFLIPLYHQEVRGAGPLAAGLLLAPLGLGALVSNPLAGKAVGRVGPRVLVVAGAVAIAATAVVFLTSGPGTPVGWLAAWTLVAGLGVGCVGAPTMATLYTALPGDVVPRATSAVMILHQLGAAFGIAVVALVLQRNLAASVAAVAYPGTFWALLAAAVLILGAGLAMPRQ